MASKEPHRAFIGVGINILQLGARVDRIMDQSHKNYHGTQIKVKLPSKRVSCSPDAIKRDCFQPLHLSQHVLGWRHIFLVISLALLNVKWGADALGIEHNARGRIN